MTRANTPVDGETVLLRRHAALVEHLLTRYCPPVLAGGLTVEDARSAATAALLRAIRTYDEGRRITFATFAAYRIRGAILDECRVVATTTRTAQRRKHAAGRAWNRLANRLGRRPTHAEHAAELGITPDTLTMWQLAWERAKGHAALWRTMYAAPISGDAVEDSAAVHAALATLPMRLQDALYSMYWRNESVAMLAARWQCSLPTVYRECRRAYQLVRAALVAQGFDTTAHRARRSGRVIMRGSA